jgi:hypothetical protein
MPALFFPTPDALRLALTSGLVPPEVARAPALACTAPAGRAWIEPPEPLARETVAALARFGVQVHGAPGVPTRPVGCWAELFPLRAASAPSGGLVLFEVPDRFAPALAARLQRTGAPVGLRLLDAPRGGRAWVVAPNPDAATRFWLAGAEPTARAFREQQPNVWVPLDREHPLAAHLAVPTGGVLLCEAGGAFVPVPGSVPEPRAADLRLPRRAARTPRDPAPRLDISFRLARAEGGPPETLWVLTEAERAAFVAFCSGADERLLKRFEVAAISDDTGEVLVVRRAPAADGAAVLPFPDGAFRADERHAGLFVPVGLALRPAVRARELARALNLSSERVVWLERATEAPVARAVAQDAFGPLLDAMEYTAPVPQPLAADALNPDLFAFERFAVRVEPSVELDDLPEWHEPAPAPEAPRPAAQPGWVAKSLSRVLRWVRRAPAAPSEGPPAVPVPVQPASRVARQLASADALLHGNDRAARRQDLESRLLTDAPRLAPDARAARWAELAGAYSATGQALDAAVCWANALWECAAPPREWLEQWAAAECKAARPGDAGDLERWLGEPGRPGTGRVVAALAALHGFRAPPAPEFVANLPRVLGVLDQQFDDIPARAAWLARLAVARATDGDALGLARWRDRLLARLRERGPGLDLDEPSFLRFRGAVPQEQFKRAREWLVRMREPILKWVARHAAGSSGLHWAGLDAEPDATGEYAQLLLAWGLGVLGERARARDWAARARKALSSATGPRADPAGHALLGDLFLHRVRDAYEGHPPKPQLPDALQTRLDKLPEFARYSVDRLRQHSRVLQPGAPVSAFRGRDLRAFFGEDQLGDRLAVLSARSDPGQVNDEARALLALATERATPSVVPRVAVALLEVAAHLDEPTRAALLALAPLALAWTEEWVRSGRWPENERADRVLTVQARALEAAFAVAPAEVAAVVLRHLANGGAPGAALLVAPRAFRAARRHGLLAEAEALAQTLDPARGTDLPASLAPEHAGLAAAWFVAGDDEAGNRVLNAAREALFLSVPGAPADRTKLATAYAEALGFAPHGIALGRLEELFQRLDRVAVQSSSNCYYTLYPLHLLDTVVRAVVTDDFAISPAVRAWLDDDEFLIRRRVHRDMAAVLRADVC